MDGVPPSTKAKQAGEALQPEARQERPDYETVVATFVDRSTQAGERAPASWGGNSMRLGVRLRSE